MLNLDTQSVIGQPDIRRQQVFRFDMTEVVADVGEPCALRTGRRRHFQRLAQGQVARMRFVAQGVDDERRYVGDLRDDLGRDVVAIAEVGGQLPSAAGKNVSVDEHLAVRHFGRGQFDVTHGEGPGNLAGIGTDVIPEGMLSVEGVIEHAPQVGHGARRGVNRHGAVGHFAKTPQVVETGHVVGMRVGEDRGVDAAQSVAQRLGAQVGSGVDKQDGFTGFDQDGRPQAPVTLVVGPANAAIAGHERDALGCAGAEKRDRKFGHD